MSVLKGEGTYPILFDTTSIPIRALTHTAYVARPDRAGDWPTAMVVGGSKGLSSPIRDLCRRLARHGFATVAPDLYSGRKVPEDPAEASLAFHELPSGEVGRILTDIGRHLADGRGPWATEEKGFAVIAAQSGALPGLRTAVEFGSPMVMMAPALREPSPGLDADFNLLPPPPGVPDELAGMVEPLLGLIGRNDDVSPPGDVAAARKMAPHSQWVIYEGLGHDFLDDNEPGFDQAAFTDAFGRIVEFLTKNL